MPTVESDRGAIYYETHGPADAPALVLGHGAGGNRMIWWQQVPFFADRYRVVTFDHRSFGRSTCAPEDFAPRYFAPDLLRILDSEHIDRCVYVGQSMGGWTGMGLALHHPDRLKALAFCSTPGGLWTASVPAAMAAIGARIRSAGVEAHLALAPDYPEREPAMTHLYAQIAALNTNLSPRALGSLFAEDARVDPAALAGHRLPTLVVAGGRDLLFPMQVMREVAAAIPGAVLHELPACGHSTYFEDATSFNALLDRFLAAHA